MTAEDILKILFLVLCDRADGKMTMTAAVIAAVPSDWMNRLSIDEPAAGRLRLRVLGADQIRLQSLKNKHKLTVDMDVQTIFKMLFVLLCYVDDGEVEVLRDAVDRVPRHWPRMLHLDRPGVELFRLQVKDEDKPILWDKDIMVPVKNHGLILN